MLTGVTEARAKATQAQITLPPDVLTNPDAMKKYAEAHKPAYRRASAAVGGFGTLPRYQIRGELHGLAEPA